MIVRVTEPRFRLKKKHWSVVNTTRTAGLPLKLCRTNSGSFSAETLVRSPRKIFMFLFFIFIFILFIFIYILFIFSLSKKHVLWINVQVCLVELDTFKPEFIINGRFLGEESVLVN